MIMNDLRGMGYLNGGGGVTMAAPEAQRSASKQLKAQEQAEYLDRDEEKDGSERIKYVEDKTFVLKDGYWTDGAYDPEKKLSEVKIEFMSDEYFKLLDKNPDIGKYLAVGENVKLVWDGKLYIITGEKDK